MIIRLKVSLYSVPFIMLFSYHIDTLLGKQHIPEKDFVLSISMKVLFAVRSSTTNISYQYFDDSKHSFIGTKILLDQKAIIMKWLLKSPHKQDISGTSWCISEHQELAGGSGRRGGEWLMMLMVGLRLPGLVQLSHYSSDATLLLNSKNSDLHGTSTSCIN